MEKQLLLGVLVVCMVAYSSLAAGPSSRGCSNNKKTMPCGPSRFSFFLHNMVYDPRVNNTYFNSVYALAPALKVANPLFFGVMGTFEDPLTAGRANTSAQIGRGQGFFLLDSKEEFTLFYVFTATINKGPYQGSISIMGQQRRYNPLNYLTVTGGTGAFLGARGLATSTILDLKCRPSPTRWTHSYDLDLYY